MALFSKDGKLIDPDGLKAVNFGKGSRVPAPRIENGNQIVTVPHCDDGRPAGEITYKKDGSISSSVFLRAAEANA